MNMLRMSGLVVSLVLVVSAATAAAPAYKIINRIALPDGGFDYAAFDPVANRIYFARTDFTNVLDVKTGQVTTLANASHGHVALPLPGTQMVLVTQGRAGMARLVDVVSGAVLADIPVGKNPDAATYDPFSKHVFVMNHDSGDATEIDPITRKAVSTIPVGGMLEFAVSDGKGKLFVNDEEAGEIGIIDTVTHKAIGRYKMNGCDGPTGLAFDAADGLLISSCDGVAKVLRADDGREVASVAIGAGADAVIFDARNRLVFIPCGRGAELDVVSLADLAHIVVIQRVMTEPGSRTGTMDTNTGRIYMIGAKQGVAPAGGGRAQMQPGSYEVLVIAP